MTWNWRSAKQDCISIWPLTQPSLARLHLICRVVGVPAAPVTRRCALPTLSCHGVFKGTQAVLKRRTQNPTCLALDFSFTFTYSTVHSSTVYPGVDCTDNTGVNSRSSRELWRTVTVEHLDSRPNRLPWNTWNKAMKKRGPQLLTASKPKTLICSQPGLGWQFTLGLPVMVRTIQGHCCACMLQRGEWR